MDVTTVPRPETATAHPAPTERPAAVKVVFFVSEDWWFCLHWLNLAQRLKARGHDITIICNVGIDRERIELAGFKVVPLRLDRSGLNVLNDVRIASDLIAFLRRERPALIHCVGMKPILIGTLAARLIGGIRILNHFAGLGYLFSSNHLKARLLRPLVMLGMRAAFSGHEVHLVTMNRTDRDVLMRWKLNEPDHTHVIGGTGLDLARYPVLPFPKSGPVTIAITTRMIEDKGLAGLVEAFRQVRARFPDTELLLVGKQDGRNPTAIPEEQLRAWDQEPGIHWLGHVDRVAEQVWARAHIAVLPSRREGLPVSLLEAAACGRPMVATDVPGCREVVIDGETGLLAPLDDVQTLAKALETLVASEELRQRFGAGARDLVERQFSLDVISDRVAGLYRFLVQSENSAENPPEAESKVQTGAGR
jgi:glycosyltransferase involved in cell wall biosynthesis